MWRVPNVARACVVGLRGALRSTAPAGERFLLEHFSIKRMPGLDPSCTACQCGGPFRPDADLIGSRHGGTSYIAFSSKVGRSTHWICVGACPFSENRHPPPIKPGASFFRDMH
jgi:hypothetical protein